MKRSARVALVVLLGSLLVSCSRLEAQPGAGAGAQATPESEEEKTLYALGAMISRNLQEFAFAPEEVPFVLQGLRDALEERESAVPLDEYSPRIHALAAERRAGRLAVEKEAAAAFLADEAAAEGAESFPSGLVMRVLVPGSGASPAATDTVKVHYHGTLRDGSVFDSSVERGEPASIPLNRVVPCWTEALQQMSVGEKTRIA
ncbi:MAG: FKBP-type peptidyl-prolyl cis-trans isomerase, partial [Deltaproteobacteria bacterium]